jgi:mannosyltransferase OCH1-like enzyme
MIPKIIHYCWLSNDPIPNKLKKYIQSWQEKLVGYQFMLWNFERFDINESRWVKEAFNNKKYAFAADFIRLYAVYNYGGIYLDMDVEIIRPFSNELLNKSNMLAFENDECTSIEAGIFGSEKKAEWLKDCLSYYTDRSFINSDNSFDMKVLPQIMFDILYDKYIKTNIIKPYAKDFFTVKSLYVSQIMITSNTYTIHHFAGSWISPKIKIRDKIYLVLKKLNLLNVIRYFKYSFSKKQI